MTCVDCPAPACRAHVRCRAHHAAFVARHIRRRPSRMDRAREEARRLFVEARPKTQLELQRPGTSKERDPSAGGSR